MKVRRFLVPVTLLAAIAGGIADSPLAMSQESEVVEDAPVADRVSIFDAAKDLEHPSESYFDRNRMTPQQLRTARAIYRANQRVARLEQNLWMGYEPLRPRWNSIPMMSSRYTNPKFYVPVYIYNR